MNKAEIEERIQKDLDMLYEQGEKQFGLSAEEITIMIFASCSKYGFCNPEAIEEYIRRLKTKGIF